MGHGKTVDLKLFKQFKLIFLQKKFSNKVPIENLLNLTETLNPPIGQVHTVRNHMSLGQLFIGFLEYYTQNFK